MEVIPAIDLIDGKCVQLVQGDYDRKMTFSDDPVGMAAHWVEEGASRIHVVDLDGAKDGKRGNATVVAAIARSVGVPIQVGGGIRTAADADELLGLGVDRVIFGTAAVERPDDVAATVSKHGGQHVIAGIDARNGIVATRGWQEDSGRKASDLIAEMIGYGVVRVIYTDIARDGMMRGPNVNGIIDILSSTEISLIAAGGIAQLDDLLAVAGTGAEAAVTGTAIYTGAIDLKAAIRKLQENI
jgi:phosphoribosylformimino-5-aminoimidazole carboxamide ribotide isomerase